MGDALDELFSQLYNLIMHPIKYAVESSGVLWELIQAIGNGIVFILNIFRDVPITEITDTNGDVTASLLWFYDINYFLLVISQIIGVLVLIWILRIFYQFIKFIIDLVLGLVKDLQREIKMNYYLKNKKGGHKQL